ncbi:MAG: DUF3656 domain-containing protein [Coriobacteriia bacterium]|nr:DUF3656 domain-containing protein [Coriobacteriia bacterium]
MTENVELLAPAGTVAALHAAVAAGADAVYLGLDQFNARRGADNFTMDTFKEACDYAHLRGVHVYLAFNTIILPDEVGKALEYARQAWRRGADAFIIQDPGIAAELHRTLPQAPIHASTQMNVHSAAGVEAAAALGASRVTLARELSLEEVQHLCQVAREFDMSVEVFAHGALCVCYSGQCLMSSMIGGRSANRGTCAQACRLPYELQSASSRKGLKAPGEYLLSPKDLCTIDLLPRMLQAGVQSFKIEGRMKSPDYVYAVTSVYRSVLDRAMEDPYARATEEEKRVLAEAFSRGFTAAYLTGDRGNDIMSYQRPNNRGISIGRVEEAGKGKVSFRSSVDLAIGDILEVWTKKGRAILTVVKGALIQKSLYRLRYDEKDASARAIRQGDRIFRVRSAAASFEDEPFEPRIPVEGYVRIRTGMPLYIEFRLADPKRPYAVGAFEGAYVEPARTKALTEEDVRSHVDRLGQTPYYLVDLQVELDDGLGMGFSALHKARAAALEDLGENLLADYNARRLPRTERREALPAKRGGKCQVVVIATNPACARAAKRSHADVIVVPALTYKRGEAMIAGQLSKTAEQAGYPSQSIIALPTVDHDPVGEAREASVALDPWQFVKEGDHVLVDSMASLARAKSLGAVCEVGAHVPVTNAESLRLMADWGVERVWLSPELTLKQFEELVGQDSPVPVGCMVVGYQELMVTEHCLLMSQGPCNQDCAKCARRKTPHHLHDRKGYDFPVVTDAMGRSHLYNGVKYDVAHLVPELIKAGAAALMIDATLMNVEETAQAVGRVVRARELAMRDGNTVSKESSATSGHLYRGVS